MKKKNKTRFYCQSCHLSVGNKCKKTAIFELGLAEVGHVSKTFELRKVEF